MKDLIHQYITTGRKVPKHQFNQLSNNQVKSYLRVRTIGNQSLDGYELDRLSDEERNSYILNLNPLQVSNLLHTSKERDKDIMMLLNTEGFIDNLGKGENATYLDDYCSSLLRYTSDPEKVMLMLGKKGEMFVSKPEHQRTIINTIEESVVHVKLILTLLNTKGFIDNLIQRSLQRVFDFTEDQSLDKDIIDKLMTNDNFVKNLDEYKIVPLLANTTDPFRLVGELITKLGRDKVSRIIEDIDLYSNHENLIFYPKSGKTRRLLSRYEHDLSGYGW